MPKKTKKTIKHVSPASKRELKSKNDFFFFLVISVFAALTIFAASYLNTAKNEVIRASQKTQSLDVAPLNIE